MAALQSGVAGGRAGNSSMLAQALGDVSPSSANGYVETHLRNHASSGRLEFASSEVIGFVFDAARLGQPPEETVLFFSEKLDLKDCRNMWTPEAVAMMALLIHTLRPHLDCGIFSWNSTLPICKIGFGFAKPFPICKHFANSKCSRFVSQKAFCKIECRKTSCFCTFDFDSALQIREKLFCKIAQSGFEFAESSTAQK